jgi:hypothetical protein
MSKYPDDNIYHFMAIQGYRVRGDHHIPFFSLGKHWEIRVVVSNDVYARLIVRHRDFPDKLCSVFLDVDGKTGLYREHKKFWEVYPVKRDKKTGQYLADRCMIDDIPKLKRLINLSIRIQTENFGRNKKGRIGKNGKRNQEDSNP